MCVATPLTQVVLAGAFVDNYALLYPQRLIHIRVAAILLG